MEHLLFVADCMHVYHATKDVSTVSSQVVVFGCFSLKRQWLEQRFEGFLHRCKDLVEKYCTGRSEDKELPVWVRTGIRASMKFEATSISPTL